MFNDVFLQVRKPVISSKYLVDSPQCQIRSINPFAADVMEFFITDEFEPCSEKKPLTSIEQNFVNNSVKVVFHRELTNDYLSSEYSLLKCCYQVITRSEFNSSSDNKFK